MPLRTGFTLIEVLVVLVILTVITTLGVLAVRTNLAQQELRYSADRIRGEWIDTRVHAMENGQIFCMRAKIGGSTIIIDRILDTHFTAGLSSRQTTSRYDNTNEYDPFERGGFTGDVEDFVLRNPDTIPEGSNVITIQLPETVVIADVIAVAEERAAFYLGLVAPEGNQDEEVFMIEPMMTGEPQPGETTSADGLVWSTPIFFYPDGSTSTAAILLKNKVGSCIEVRLRGLTGTGTLTESIQTTNYVGELNANRF